MTNWRKAPRRAARFARRWLRGDVRWATRRLMGAIESPDQGQRIHTRPIPVYGWAFDPDHPLLRVLIEIDGEVRAATPVRERRDDVADRFPEVAAARRSGWGVDVDVLPGREPTRIRAIAVRRDGRMKVIGAVAVHSPRAASTQAGNLTGSLEGPEDGARLPSDPFWIQGWALPENAVDRVVVRVGDVQETAMLGLPRKDLEVFDDTWAPVGGFRTLFDPQRLPDLSDPVTIEAWAEDERGARSRIGHTTISFAHPPESSSASDRSAQLRERTRRVLAPALTSRPVDDGINLVSIAHDLGVGGGQLYLVELLRRLSFLDGFAATLVAPRDGPLRDTVEGLGIRVHISPGMPIASVDALRSRDAFEGKVAELATWIAAEGFNVGLVNTMSASIGAEALGRLGVPFLWAIHESWDPRMFWAVAQPEPLDPYGRERLIDALRRAAGLIFETSSTRAEYEGYAEPDRMLLVPYGIPLDEVEHRRARAEGLPIRTSMGLDNRARLVLCMGTIDPRKGQVPLAQAFARIATRHPTAVLVLVGDQGGLYSEGLHTYVERSGLSHRIHILPVQMDPYPWYAAADLFVSASDVESTPRSLLEVMAFEVPVVATDVYGVGELIDDGATGYLCEPRDIGSLSRALDRALSAPPTENARIARAACEAIHEHHDSSGYAREFARMLRELASSGVDAAAAEQIR